MKILATLFICGVLWLVAGCASGDSGKGAAVVIVPRAKVHLRAKMSDEEILRALGFDPARMKAEFAQGADGESTTYSGRHGESVLITRSVVSGVFVMHDYPGGSREWQLGNP